MQEDVPIIDTLVQHFGWKDGECSQCCISSLSITFLGR